MPSFMNIKEGIKKRSEKFGKRLVAIFDTVGIAEGPVRTIPNAVVKATARFLAGFGSEVVRLNKISREALSRRDPGEQAAMRAFAIRKLTNETRSNIQAQIEGYAKGKISIATLKTNLQSILRRQAIAASVIGVGGVGNLTENILTAVQRQLSVQFEKLDGFINDLSLRQLTQRDRARANLYANEAHLISQTASRQASFDAYGVENLEERRMLGGAEHCEDCVDYASQGWVQAGTLPPPGVGSVCGASCRCTIQVRVADVNQDTPVPEQGG